VISNIKAHFGFARMPFGKDLAPDALHQHKGHAEAVARISWCISEGALGLVTGEVGSGKTAAVRAATSTLDPRAHHVIYLGCPRDRRQRYLRRDRSRARQETQLP
jgi:type II secretory pathway predicted ATPase ExeA